MPPYGDNRRARVAARRRATLVIAVAVTSAALGVLIVDHDSDTPATTKTHVSAETTPASTTPSPVSTVTTPATQPAIKVGASNTAGAGSTSVCVSSTHPAAAARMSASIATTLAQRRQSVVAIDASDPNLGVTCAVNPTWHFRS